MIYNDRNSKSDTLRSQSRKISDSVVTLSMNDAKGKIYGGSSAPSRQKSETNQRPETKKGKNKSRKKRSTFQFIVYIFIIVLAFILYVSNVIAVNQLNSEISQLELRYQQLIAQREYLKAEINALSSPERIRKIASEKIGLIDAGEVPGLIEIIKTK